MIPEKDLKIERIKGKGPGGQHKNKTASRVRVTHLPTGISCSVDGRHQHKNLKQALKELTNRIKELNEASKAKEKKTKRDKAIHDTRTIRTYDYKSGVVKDHRTKKQASLKEVLFKGNLDLLK